MYVVCEINVEVFGWFEYCCVVWGFVVIGVCCWIECVCICFYFDDVVGLVVCGCEDFVE